jgi:hypothetical protein
MGVSLHLGPDIEFPSETEHTGKSFFDEIISAIYPDYFKHEEFLNSEEQALLHPDYREGSEPLDAFESRDPAALRAVFGKVLENLKLNESRYPWVHTIWTDASMRMGSSTSDRFKYNEQECYIDGYHNNNAHQHELLIYRLREGWEPFEWVKAAPLVVLDGIEFYVSSKSKYAQYKDILEELIAKCESAERSNLRVLWLFAT